ncbi:hypothetical protein [Streptomyces sp. NPDC093225]|uniref:hypothetical protein n=1 Tax=Streptomyces sp. NPDC093225 TaxID=3366034 RepID=UPI003801EC86
MTETTVEPIAPPETDTPTSEQAAPDPAPAPPQVEHTPGGIPVLPLALSGANTTAGLVGAAALAGGPIAAAVAMTGAVVLGAAATRQRTNTKRSARVKAGATGSKAGASRSLGASAGGRSLKGHRPASGRVPSPSRTGARSGGTGSRKHSAAARTSAGRRSAAAPSAGLARATATKAREVRPKAGISLAGRAVGAVGRLGGGWAGQVRDVRAAARQQHPTRSAARTATLEARRGVADSRRAAKAADRKNRTAPGSGRGPAARTLAKGMAAAAKARDKAAGGLRAARDRATGRKVASGRAGIRQAAHTKRVAQLKAPAQKAARKALRRSAARFHARRAAAGLLGGLLGVLGTATTWLGRKLGIGWLMYPGRRLYRWLVDRAKAQREQRDAAIRAQLEQDEQAAQEQAETELKEECEPIGDRAARPASRIPAPPMTEGAQVSNTSGFRFEELAAELEQAAQSYEPESAMEILAMVDGLPEALTSIANVMRILAERSDSEFPLEKEIAGGFDDIYGALNSAVAVAEDLGPMFRQVHEADIARHEDPRNGTESEKGWNV